MINNVKVAIEKAKTTLRELLELGDVPCTYTQSGQEITGCVIKCDDSLGVDIYLLLRPDVKVRSSTGKEYFILLTSITSIKGLGNL